MPENRTNVQLGHDDLTKMRHLTHELSEVLDKISHLVLPKLGGEVECKNFVISLSQAGKPMQIQFRGSSGSGPSPERAVYYGGIYEDPPGVCRAPGPNDR